MAGDGIELAGEFGCHLPGAVQKTDASGFFEAARQFRHLARTDVRAGGLQTVSGEAERFGLLGSELCAEVGDGVNR